MSQGIARGGLRVVLAAAVTLMSVSGARAQTLNVPADYATIQAAIDAASNGALVLVAPGTYVENLVINGKDITLASEFLVTGDPAVVPLTIIDGGGGPSTLHIQNTATLKIIGLTIQNSSDGIKAVLTFFELLDCIVRDTGDGLDWEGKDGLGGGAVRNCLFDDNSDDAIDLDDSTAAVIENNILRNCGDDGIEIRLHGHLTPQLDIIIRDNVIYNCLEDGIQLIGYGQTSNRTFTIERNLIYNNVAAGIGMMDDSDTNEDFRGAPLPEPMYIAHNVFDGHVYGITGGINVTFVDNAVMNSTMGGFKNVNGASLVSYTGVWQNATDFENSTVGPGIVTIDPQMNLGYGLTDTSPYIDAGDPACIHPNLTTCDIGRYEFGSEPSLPPVANIVATPGAGDAPLLVQLEGPFPTTWTGPSSARCGISVTAPRTRTS